MSGKKINCAFLRVAQSHNGRSNFALAWVLDHMRPLPHSYTEPSVSSESETVRREWIGIGIDKLITHQTLTLDPILLQDGSHAIFEARTVGGVKPRDRNGLGKSGNQQQSFRSQRIFFILREIQTLRVPQCHPIDDN